jgi:catechol 2,3-dioxygenase-like lactoylglutathione lyase family enzyme
MKSLVAFIPTRDADRAREFYERVVGLRFVRDDGFAIVMDFNGTMVRIAKVGDYQPFAFTLLGWEVHDIGPAVKELTAKGASVERYSFLEQDAAGVWNAPGGAKVAWFKDPDGNLLSISQHPASARKASKRQPKAAGRPVTAARFGTTTTKTTKRTKPTKRVL